MLGYIYYKKLFIMAEIEIVIDTSAEVNVKRRSGSIIKGYLQRISEKGAIIAWKDDNGEWVGKRVPLSDFVELNSKYVYLLPVVQPNTVTFTFSPEQVEAFQQCTDCPPCFKNV
jgi:hypothetical protein